MMAQGVVIKGRLDIRVEPTGVANQVVVATLGPAEYPGRQRVAAAEWSRKPTRVFRDPAGQRYATFEFRQLRAPATLTCVFEVETEARGTLATVRERPAPLKAPGDRAAWLSAEEWLEADDPTLKAEAKKLKTGVPVRTVERCYEFVRDRLKYGGFLDASQGAAKALASGRGDCTDFTDLFVALCRACGVPARHCTGYLAGTVPAGDVRKHSWAEVHLPDAGWAMLDPLHSAQGTHAWNEVRNRYVWATRLRNDPRLGGHETLYWTAATGNLKVTETFVPE